MQPMSPDSQEPARSERRSFDEAGDATRRTRLANERTYLAWWRTGLTSLAVSLGAGKVVPALTSGTRWPYTVVGVGFAAIGLFFIAYAFVRHGRVERAVSRGEFAPPDERLVAALAVVGVVLSLFVLTILATQS
jgi:inner membrane protein YidH